VVVDDGSPDKAAEVAAQHGVCCIRQENRGVSEARNAGFRASHGDYVVFIDADDKLLPRSIEAHLECFAEHPNAGFVVGKIDILKGAIREELVRSGPVLSDQYEELLKANHVANTIAVMFRRAVIETVGGFDPALSAGEDYELLLRVARSFSGANHSTVVALYRRHGTNVSRDGARMLRAMLSVMRSQRSFLRGNARLKKAFRTGKTFWRDWYGGVTVKQIFIHLRNGRPLAAVKALTALLWHVRWRIALLPWKHRDRVLSVTQRGVRRLRTCLNVVRAI
jgi:glycosyltransferase involved in cell wall biosynthesis